LHEEWSVPFFQRSIREGFVWLDYHSIPQDRTEHASQQAEAIQSINVYVGHTTNFFALTPNSLHEGTGERVGLGSWKKRGWCRLEDWCAEARSIPTARRPLIITSGNQLHVVDVLDKLTYDCTRDNIPATGNFSVPSDKDNIHAVFLGALQIKLHSLLESNSLFYFRWFMFVAPHLSASSRDFDGRGNGDTNVDDFLNRYGFKTIDECPPRLPFMPLFCAAAEGNRVVLSQLLEAKADPDQWDSSKSVNPVHGVATYGDPGCMERLLAAGGDPDSPSLKLRLTPLHRAAAGGHEECVQILLKHGAKINPIRQDTGRTPLHMAALNAHQRVMSILLGAGANEQMLDKDSHSPLDLLQQYELNNWGVVLSSRLPEALGSSS